jgi:hypothetical protein
MCCWFFFALFNFSCKSDADTEMLVKKRLPWIDEILNWVVCCPGIDENGGKKFNKNKFFLISCEIVFLNWYTDKLA